MEGRRRRLLWTLAACWCLSTVAEETGKDPCADGTCPTPSEASSTEKCGYWMGPSPIKEREEHGFGLGLFTGRHIAEGTVVDESLLVPIYDWDDGDHPPFREYIWDGDILGTLTLTSHKGMFLFMPGAAAFAPCTSNNYNLQLVRDYRESVDPYGQFDADETNWQQFVLPPTAGSFSPYRSSMYVAARDIAPGEELTVQCDDDDFDGGAYYLSQYEPDDDDIICLDRNLEVRESYILHAGQGLFAKQRFQPGTVLISSPLVPVDRNDMKAPSVEKLHIPDHQLLLNYCIGHPDSDLLFLPDGPLVNYINHAPPEEANAKIVWHTPLHDHDKLHHRARHHHDELFNMTARQVLQTHGRGLLIDVVATRFIKNGEEILIDYGKAWRDAWKTHNDVWNKRPPIGQMTAYQYSQKHDLSELRTTEEQIYEPYPNNIMFTCSYSEEWKDPEDGEEEMEHSWMDFDTHNCRLPCIIENRYYEKVYYDDSELDENGDPISEEIATYTAYLMGAHTNPDIEWECQLVPDVEYTLSHVPRYAIEVIDRPYSTNMFLPKAFRHEIGVPDGMYPDTWITRKKKTRLRASGGSSKGATTNRQDTSLVVLNPEDMDMYKRRSTRKKLENKVKK